MTFLLVLIGWVIFRAENISQAVEYIYRMLTDFSFGIDGPNFNKKAIMWVLLLMTVEWYNRHYEFALQMRMSVWKNQLIRLVFYVFFAIFIMTYAGLSGSFIYFQF